MPSAPFFVLVVEDEPFARMVHLGAIARLPGVSAVGVGSVSEAQTIIAQQAPQVVVLDLQLADGTGIDVMARLAEQRISAVLIVVSAHIETFRNRLRHGPHLHLLAKPAPIKELLRIVEATQRTTLEPGPFSPLDYVQLACMGQHSVIISCVGSEVCGEIVIEHGVLWSAHDEQGTGVQAFTRMVLSEKALIRVTPSRSLAAPRSIEESWEGLILDAMREKDEAARIRPAKSRSEAPPPATAAPILSAPSTPSAPSAPSAKATPSPSPASASASRSVLSTEVRTQFDLHVERGVRAVVERDFRAAIAAFEEAQKLWPDAPLLRHRLERLRVLQGSS
jgi:ActR/RegA family two-component response regulator